MAQINKTFWQAFLPDLAWLQANDENKNRLEKVKENINRKISRNNDKVNRTPEPPMVQFT